MLRHLIGVALGGALGSLCRFGLSRWLARWNPHTSFSAGVLAANLLGCFLIGLMFAKIPPLEPELRDTLWALVVTGFLGGLTTFSSFSLELFQLSSASLWETVLPYLAAHLGGGLVCIALGYRLGTLV